MSKDPIARIAERQHWLAPIEQPMQNAVHAIFDSMGETGPAIRRALHGNWLHEPLHAVLTDIPVGSWTAAVVFDSIAALSGDGTLDRAADACVVFGLVGAVGAAATGMNDWADTQDAPRRIGAVHAVLNVAATGLFLASCVARRSSRSRNTGRSLAAIGLALVGVSAHLGGNLVYEHGIGVQDTKPLT
jgi:uncharacterized membrane protein